MVTNKDLEKGYLVTDGRVKVDRVFNIDKKLIRMNIGRISKPTLLEIKDILFDLVA